MEVFKSYHMFGLHFYISSRRMSREQNCSARIRENRKKLRVIKRSLYKKSGGCCQECGKKLEMDGLEIHHIIPTSENPNLVVSINNIHLVCPECHARLHGRPLGGVKIKKMSNNIKKNPQNVWRLRIFLYLCSVRDGLTFRDRVSFQPS